MVTGGAAALSARSTQERLLTGGAFAATRCVTDSTHVHTVGKARSPSNNLPQALTSELQ